MACMLGLFLALPLWSAPKGKPVFRIPSLGALAPFQKISWQPAPLDGTGLMPWNSATISLSPKEPSLSLRLMPVSLADVPPPETPELKAAGLLNGSCRF
jgi:hypothetical protein